MAQPAAGEIKAFETTAQMQARLDAFMTATGTERYDITKPQDSPDGVPLLRGDHDDLVVVSGRGKLMELVDGGGGANVLQLDTAKGDKLGVIKNIQDLQIKRSEWSNSESFGGRSLIEAKAKLINTGHIGSEVHVLGKFDNQGTVAGPIFVGEKAMFSGPGTVESLSVAGQLEVDPKRGAPSITKNLELSKSAKLIYGVNSEGDSATIKVGGTATLGNATLKISAAPGEYIDSRSHIVIEANKVEGTFAKIDSGLKFMKATVDYSNEKQVGLTYARNNVPLKEAATSKNGQNFAASVEEPQPLKPPASVPSAAPTVVQAPAVKPKIEAPANTPSKQPKITSASPKTVARSQAAKPAEKNHTATTTLPGTDMRAATDARQSKTVPPTPAEASKTTSAAPKPTTQLQAAKPAAKPNKAISALLGTNEAAAADAIDQLSAYDIAALGNVTLSSIAPISTGMLSAMGQKNPESVHSDGQVWVQAIGSSGSLAKELGDYALKHSTKGLMLGTDWAVSPDWRLGIIGSKTQTRLDSYQFDGAFDSWLVGAYALRQDGPVALRLGVVHGNHDGSTNRHVAFNGFRDRLKGRYDAITQQAFGQVGYNLDVARFNIEPYAQVGYQRYKREGYTEKGGDAALQYNDQTQEHFSSDLGLRLARPFLFDRGIRLTPRLDVGWKHRYGDVRGRSHQRLASGGKTYVIQGVELDRDSALLQAGLDLDVSPRHTLVLSYSGETGQDNRNGALMGQWRMMF